MNHLSLGDKAEILNIIKSPSTVVMSARQEYTHQFGKIPILGGGMTMEQQNTGRCTMTIELSFLPGEPVSMKKGPLPPPQRKPAPPPPPPPTVAEDPFNDKAVNPENKTTPKCPSCGHGGNLVITLVCPDHGTFAGG